MELCHWTCRVVELNVSVVKSIVCVHFFADVFPDLLQCS